MYNVYIGKSQKIISTLLPLTALPDATFEGGIEFLHWLQSSGQKGWQLLPLHQTQLENNHSGKHVPSPYKGYGIGFDPQYLPETHKKMQPTKEQIAAFRFQSQSWIEDYALFCSLRDYFSTDDWRTWNSDLRTRSKKAIEESQVRFRVEIEQHILEQCRLHLAFLNMKQEAEKLGILLIGDLPFYVSLQSPLVWAHQDVFIMNEKDEFQLVSGIPDYDQGHFGRQIWGHPLYNWENILPVKDFWKNRFDYLAKLYDLIRFDHTKAFFYYGVMDTTTEQNDRFEEGPGAGMFKEFVDYCSEIGLSIFAEDTGGYLEALRLSLDALGIPGMKIFRYAYNEQKKKVNNDYAEIEKYPLNCVVYSTTHDSETLMSYLALLTSEEKKLLAGAAKVTYSEDDKLFVRSIIQALLESSAKVVIIPIQDWLLQSERINVPGTEKSFDDPNWRYKLKIPIEKLPTKLF